MAPQAILSWLFFVNMFMLFLIACVLYVKYQRSLENKEIVELTNKLLQERYDNLKDIYDAEAKMSHDHQAALAYMETLLKPINQAVNEVWTGNNIFDFILNCKKNEAKEKAVSMKIQAK